MAGHFNYDPIRNTAIGLLTKFGRKTPMILLRAVEASPPDPDKPWRVGAPTIKHFQFIGVANTLGFPRRSDPIVDGDQDVIAPGTLATTAADGDPATLCGDPTVVDRLQIGEKQYAILGVQDITPDDNKSIIYKFRCRAWPLLMTQPSTTF